MGTMYDNNSRLIERLRQLVGSKDNCCCCWDYCVIWKLSEDHRFLEWFDCSCAGWNHRENGTEEEEENFRDFTADCSSAITAAAIVPCKDVIVQHPRRNSCELLAQLPSSLPLDGINAEVLMSNEPRWLKYVKSSSASSDSISDHGGRVETKVLIPAPGGLIELFAAKQVTEDQTVVDFVLSQLDGTTFLEQEPPTTAITSGSLINHHQQQQQPSSLSANMNTATEETSNLPSYYNMGQGQNNNINDHHHTHNSSSSSFSPSNALESLNLSTCEATADRIRICNSAMNFLQQFNYLAADQNRTSSTPNNKDEFHEPIYQQTEQQQQQQPGTNSFVTTTFVIGDEIENSRTTTTNNEVVGVNPELDQQLCTPGDENGSTGVKNELPGGGGGGSRGVAADSLSDSDQLLDIDEDDSKGGGSSSRRRSSNGKGQSKNLVAERKRRKKLNERLYNLRSLVPKISKLDRASILGDAIEYVMELKQQAKELEDELEQNSEEEMMEEEDGGCVGVGGNNNGSSSLLISGGNNPSMEFSGVKFGGGIEFDHEKLGNGFFVSGGGMKRGRNDNVSVTGGGGGESSNNNNNNNNDKTQQMEVQVEVAQLEGNEFFIKVFGEQKRGGFVRLLEALTSLGLEIINVNVTSCISLVSYVFIVEKIDSEIVQAEYLRDSLLEVTRNPAAAAAAAAAAAGEWSTAAAMGTGVPPQETGIEQQHFQYHQQLYGGSGNHGIGLHHHHLHHHRFHPFNN